MLAHHDDYMPARSPACIQLLLPKIPMTCFGPRAAQSSMMPCASFSSVGALESEGMALSRSANNKASLLQCCTVQYNAHTKIKHYILQRQ